jgi:hypothetical protein
MEGWVDRSADLDSLAKKIISWPCREVNHDFSVFQPVG